MADLISGGVTRGLIGASGAMKVADTAMSVYVQAKARKDEGAMKRALGYATDSMNDAKDATEESKTALAENMRNARKQEQTEQAARLEKNRQESAEAKAEMQANNDDANSNIYSPIDTIEISSEAIAALQGEPSVAEVQNEDSFDVSAKPSAQHTEKTVTQNRAIPHTHISHNKGDDEVNTKINNE